jgi:outer membrane immunogenic protein
LTDWSGFYIGVHGGYGWNNKNDWACLGDACSEEGGSTFVPIGTHGSSNALKGGLAGGQIGYNWQVNQWVFGIQGDGSWANIKGSAGNPLNLNDGRCGFPGSPDQTVECRTTIKAMGNLTARAGYLVTPSTLLYVKGGVNWSSIDFHILNFAEFPGGSCIDEVHPDYSSVHRTRTSGTVGGGVEQRIWNNVTIFGEYDYIATGRTSTNLNTGGTGSGGCSADFTSSTRVGNTQIVKFGFNYQFNWAAPVVAKY